MTPSPLLPQRCLTLANPDPPHPQLPEFPSVGLPTFTWGVSSGEEFASILNATYAEVVHWRRNSFSVPLGRAGRNFVTELSRLYLAFGSTSSLKIIALMAATVFPILLLQKPSKGSKTKDHIACLERRLVSWANGNLDDLVREQFSKDCPNSVLPSLRPQLF